MNQSHARAAVTAGLAAVLAVSSVPVPSIAEVVNGTDAAVQDVELQSATSADVEGAESQSAEADAPEQQATISSVDQLAPVTVSEGSVELPGTVVAKMSDETTSEVPVTWVVTGELAGTDPAELPAGSYELAGTVEGYEQTVALQLTVKPVELAPAPEVPGSNVEDEGQKTEGQEGAELEGEKDVELEGEKTGDEEVAPSEDEPSSLAASDESGTVTDTYGLVYTYPTVISMPQGFDVTQWLDEQFLFEDEQGTSSWFDLTWDVSGVDASEPGQYTASFTSDGSLVDVTEPREVTINVVEVTNIPDINIEDFVGNEYPIDQDYYIQIDLADGTSPRATVRFDDEDYANYVANRDIPDTYKLKGTIVGSSITVNATIWVQDIRSVDAVTVYTEPGVAPILPETVYVEYESGDGSSQNVTWDPIDESQYAKKGFFEVMGTVENTSIKAKAQVRVSPVVSVSEYDEVTVAGSPLTWITSTVSVEFESGWDNDRYVTWAIPGEDDERWTKAGSFDVYGTIEGLETKAVCHVTVVDSTSYESEIDVRTTIGSDNLPYSVEATLEDGTTTDLDVEWPYDGDYWDKLEQAGTFDVTGYVLGNQNFPVTAHVTVVDIASVGEIDPVYTTEGVRPSMPYSVDVVYTDGEKGTEYVDWNLPAPEAFVADASPITVTGRIGANGMPVSIQVFVQWVQPARRVVEVSTFAGWAPELPYDVELTMDDGTRRNLTVQWETPDVADYAVAGTTFDVRGFVVGSDLEVTARVSVCEVVGGNEVDVSTAAGVVPEIDENIGLELDNGETIYLYDRVSWGSIDPADVAEEGSVFDVLGEVLGTPIELVAHVSVEPVAAVAPYESNVYYPVYLGSEPADDVDFGDMITVILDNGEYSRVPVTWSEVDEAYKTTPGRYEIKGTTVAGEVTRYIQSFRVVSAELIEPVTVLAGMGFDDHFSGEVNLTVDDGTGAITRTEYAYDIETGLDAETLATPGEHAFESTGTLYGMYGETSLPLTGTVRVYAGISSYEVAEVWTVPGVEPRMPYTASVTCSDTDLLSVLARAVGLSDPADATLFLEVEWDKIDPTSYAADKDNTSFKVGGTIVGTDVRVETTVNVASITGVNSPSSVTTAPGMEPSLPYTATVTCSDGETRSVSIHWDDIPASSYNEAGMSFDVRGSIELNGSIVREISTRVDVVGETAVLEGEELNGLLNLKTEAGTLPFMPTLVPLAVSDDTIVPAVVDWETVRYSEFTKVGNKVEVTGTVEGLAGSASAALARALTGGTITAVVEVVDPADGPVPSYVAPGFVTLMQGDAFVGIPSDGTPLYYSDGTYGNLLVDWDTSMLDVDTPGSYVMYGTATTGERAACYVTVVPSQNQIASVDTFERTFSVGSTAQEISLGLPIQIGVTYTNGDKGLADVSWDLTALTGAVLAKPGVVEVTGTVTGTDIVAKAKVTLVDDGSTVYPTGVVNTEAETFETIAPELPETVELTMSDGSKKSTGVTWNTPAPIDYAEGTAGTTFTVEGITDEGGFTVTATVTVKELVHVESVTISGEGIKDGKVELARGSELKLSATVTPDDAYYGTDVTWTSSDPSVVSVSADGTVKALLGGTVTITATSDDPSAPVATVEVSVPKTVVGYDVTPSTVEYTVGDVFDDSVFTLTRQYDDGTSETVLTVTQNGVIYDGPAGPDEPEEPEGSLIKTITVTGDGGNDTYVYSFTYDRDSRVISIEGVNTYQEGYDEITDRYLYGITYLDGSIEISGEGGDHGETYIETMKAMLDGEGRAVSMDYSSIDDDGYIYIRGRSKNMILGPSGQNIYPEEIEQQLNNMPYVSESLIVEENNRLVALIYPDFENGSKQGMTFDDLANLMKENITSLNKDLPGYSQIENVKVLHEEFEKTPKRSIKRYLYQH